MDNQDVLEKVQDPERLKALRETKLLDSDGEPAFDRLSRLATKLLDVPVALVSLVDEDRQYFKSYEGLEGWAADDRETPLSHSFCKHVVATSEPLVVKNAPDNALVCDNLAIPDLGVVAYAGMPITLSDGQTLGSFCIIDTTARDWTDRDLEILNDLTQSVITEIELRRELQARADAEERIREQNRELIAANHELAVARKEAEEANRIKDEFLANMSHELRTPLNAIIGYTQLVSQGICGPTTEAQDENMTRVLANAESLLDLINNILDLAKIESGRIDIVDETVDVSEWVQSIVFQMEGLAERKGLTLTTEVDPDMPDHIIGDPDRLKQIVVNFISNAVKFTDEGQINLHLRRKGDDQWQIAVKDTGEGIAAHAQEYIFDQFRQADGSSRRKHGGTGLGLSIVKRLVIMMDGSVDLTSTVGEGSTFTVTLPLKTKPEPAAEAQNG